MSESNGYRLLLLEQHVPEILFRGLLRCCQFSCLQSKP